MLEEEDETDVIYANDLFVTSVTLVPFEKAQSYAC